MAQSLMTLIFTGLLLLAQTLGINTGTEPKSVNDLMSAFNDLRASFLEEPGKEEAAPGGKASGTPAQAGESGEPEDKVSQSEGSQAEPGTASVESFVLGAGESWETTYYVADSGQDGPTVMVVAGLHGDEPAVTLAAQELIQEIGEVIHGKVILLPEANPAAIAAKKRVAGADLNRAFPTEAVHGEAPVPQEPAAAAIWQLVEEYNPDWLIDLHDESSDVTGQTVVFHDAHEESAWAAQALANHLNEALDEADIAFRTASGPAAGSLAKAAAELLDTRSLTLETHRRHSLSARAGWLTSGVAYLLTYLGMR